MTAADKTLAELKAEYDGAAANVDAAYDAYDAQRRDARIANNAALLTAKNAFKAYTALRDAYIAARDADLEEETK
jgi:hypothetical protein